MPNKIMEEIEEERAQTELTFFEKFSSIQTALKVPKNQYNSYGDYSYRSKEDILQALKPYLTAYGLAVIVNDTPVVIGQWMYIESKATITDGRCERSAFGYAREVESKKGMDPAQITGAASSYAGKYALCNLLALDDGADADSQKPETEKKQPEGEFIAHCKTCGARYQFQTIEQMQGMRCCAHPDYEVE